MSFTMAIVFEEAAKRSSRDFSLEAEVEVRSAGRLSIGDFLVPEDPPDLERDTELWRVLEQIGFSESELSEANDRVLTSALIAPARARFRNLKANIISRLELVRLGDEESVPLMDPLALLDREDRVEFLELLRLELDLEPEAEPNLTEWAWRVLGAMPVPSVRLDSALEAAQEERNTNLMLSEWRRSELSWKYLGGVREAQYKLVPVRPDYYDGPTDIGFEPGPEVRESRTFLPWRKPHGRTVVWDAARALALGLDPEKEFNELLEGRVLVEGAHGPRLMSVYLGPMEPAGFNGLIRLCPAGVRPEKPYDRPPTFKEGAEWVKEKFLGLSSVLRTRDRWPEAVMVNKAKTGNWVVFWSFDDKPMKNFREEACRTWVQMHGIEQVTLGWLSKKAIALLQSWFANGAKFLGAELAEPGFVKFRLDTNKGEQEFTFRLGRSICGELLRESGLKVRPVSTRDKQGKVTRVRVELTL